MKNLNLFFLLVIFVSLLSFSKSSGQEYPRWNLPPGAVARLGKGEIHEVKYSPDGGTIAVASSIGIWLYDTHGYGIGIDNRTYTLCLLCRLQSGWTNLSERELGWRNSAVECADRRTL